MGTTRPTTDFWAPAFSIFAIRRGRADSDGAKAIRKLFMMYLISLKIEAMQPLGDSPQHADHEDDAGQVKAPIRLASWTRLPTPCLPMV